MLMSHGTYYGFFSIHLEKLGYDGTFIGLAWALASIAEIVVMVRSRWVFSKLSYENVLILSFVVATFRWFFSGFVVSPYLILLAADYPLCDIWVVSHGKYPLYGFAITRRIHKTFGQAVNNATTYGLGLDGRVFRQWFFV